MSEDSIEKSKADKPQKSRRGKGEGSIAQRSNGLWVARIDVGCDANGKRLRKYVYGKKKQDVAAKLTKLQSARLDGGLVDTGKMTVAELIEKWLVDEAEPRCAANTVSRYRGVTEIHIKPRIGSIKLSALKPMHISTMLTAMLKEEIGQRSQGHAYAVCRRAFNIAVRWGLLSRNPCSAITAPKYSRKEIVSLTAEQAAAVLKASETSEYHALFVLALTTGMRQGELFGLRWEDVDLDKGMLSVRRSLEEVKGVLNLKEPKSKSGRRQIALPAMTVEVLWEQKRLHLASGRLATGIVFPSPEGGWIRKSNFVRRVWHPIRKAAKLPKTITFHGLRHSAASLLLSEGISVKVIQEMLGHSNVALTLNTYSHVLPGMQQQAATTFDRLLGSKIG